MIRRTAVVLLASALALVPTLAQSAEPLSGKPTAVEAPFVREVSADLSARFPTPQSARKAGYLRFTDEDDTGAISYANRTWTSIDEKHPSQLWYDVKNRLIGADFSVLAKEPNPPKLFGVAPARWHQLPAHVHYGLVGPHGTTIYGATGAATLAKSGGSIAAPTKAELVKAGIAKNIADVRFVFAFPAIWDLTVWVVPNPSGAFADKNPDVKPVHPPKPMAM